VLVLFDIDGTLLTGATREHSQALDAAIQEVHHLDPAGVRSQIAPAGRTDGEIARLILLDLGVSARRIDELSAEVREACCRVYAQICPPDLRAHVVPGIADLVRWLGERPNVTLGLVTGNYEPIGRLKLRLAGLGQWFASAPGAFGSDSEDRAALPAIARRRAGHTPRAQAVVIGDTPRDIACARADGLRCLAVTSGQYGADELSAADAVARNATELRELLEELGA
jgi:phosphoglycolate phosphatase